MQSRSALATRGKPHGHGKCAANNAKKRCRCLDRWYGQQCVDIYLKRHKQGKDHARREDGHPDPVDRACFPVFRKQMGQDRTFDRAVTTTQKITAMDGVDGPSAGRAHNKTKGNHCQPGEWFLGQKKEGGIAHSRRQCRDNAAKRQSPRHKLRYHDDSATASGHRAKRGCHRHLPCRVAAQRGNRINLQEFFSAIDQQEGRRDKGADLNVGIRDSGEDDLYKLMSGCQVEAGTGDNGHKGKKHGCDILETGVSGRGKSNEALGL